MLSSATRDMKFLRVNDGRRSDGVDVQVTDRVGAKSDWVFIMVKRTFEKYKGCIQAHRIVKSDYPQLADI